MEREQMVARHRGPRSSVERLPDALRREIERKWDDGMTLRDLVEVAARRGVSVSRTSLHRYFQRREGTALAGRLGDEDRLIDLKAAAGFLGVAPTTLRRWCARGVGPEHFELPNGALRFRLASLRACARRDSMSSSAKGDCHGAAV